MALKNTRRSSRSNLPKSRFFIQKFQSLRVHARPEYMIASYCYKNTILIAWQSRRTPLKRFASRWLLRREWWRISKSYPRRIFTGKTQRKLLSR